MILQSASLLKSALVHAHRRHVLKKMNGELQIWNQPISASMVIIQLNGKCRPLYWVGQRHPITRSKIRASKIQLKIKSSQRHLKVARNFPTKVKSRNPGYDGDAKVWTGSGKCGKIRHSIPWTPTRKGRKIFSTPGLTERHDFFLHCMRCTVTLFSCYRIHISCFAYCGFRNLQLSRALES